MMNRFSRALIICGWISAALIRNAAAVNCNGQTEATRIIEVDLKDLWEGRAVPQGTKKGYFAATLLEPAAIDTHPKVAPIFAVMPVRTGPHHHCYVATIKRTYKFKIARTTTLLPNVDSCLVFPGTAIPSCVRCPFYLDMITHENWHVRIQKVGIDALISSFQAWSSQYVSEQFESPDQAKEKAAMDLTNAKDLTIREMSSGSLLKVHNKHPSPGGYPCGGGFCAENANWGAAYISEAQQLKISPPDKTPGTCK